MDQQEQMQQMFRHIGPMIFLFWGFIYLIKITLYIIPSWQIAKKAGLSGPIALLCAIPIIGRLIFLYVAGLSDWKVMPVGPTPYYPPSYPPAPPTQAYPPAAPPQAYPPAPPPEV